MPIGIPGVPDFGHCSKKKSNMNNARNKTARKGNTHTSGSQGARGNCSPETKQQNNRIRHQEKPGCENENEEGDTRDKRKTTRRKDKTNGKEIKKNEEVEENGKGVWVVLC